METLKATNTKSYYIPMWPSKVDNEAKKVSYQKEIPQGLIKRKQKKYHPVDADVFVHK